MNADPNLVLLSAGGTGGHMFPAAALARDLVSRGYRVALITDLRGSHYRNIFGDIDLHVIKSSGLQKGFTGKLKGALSFGVGFLKAGKLLDKLKPAIVVGFGGYASAPAVYAAQRRQIPTVIHEQNAVIGRANLFLAPKTDRIALSNNQVAGLEEADAVRAVVTGNPVREEIADLYNKPYPALVQDGQLNIFVMGGSLGARVFSEVLPPVLSKLSAEYRARLDITQQCREEDLDAAGAVYEQAGIKARLSTFFDDVPDILAASHLVIARSGASTVAEVTAAGRPAIFVPYPHHADQQQKMNAEIVVDAGGAWIMSQEGFTEDAILARIETFLQNPQTLFNAAEAARSCGKPDAARRLGNLVMAIASGWDKDAKRPFDLTQGRRG